MTNTKKTLDDLEQEAIDAISAGLDLTTGSTASDDAQLGLDTLYIIPQLRLWESQYHTFTTVSPDTGTVWPRPPRPPKETR